MDELFISKLRIINNDENIINELKKKIKINTDNYLFSFEFDKKKKDEQNEKIELCKKFLDYYWLLLAQCIQFQIIMDAVNYIKYKHQNIMTTAHSITNDKLCDREIYLTHEEIEDMHLFINWFENNFKQNEEQESDDYT